MSASTSSQRPPLSEELAADPQSDRRELAGQREPARSRSTSTPLPTASAQMPPPLAGRRRLTTSYLQGDFAKGQRTLPLRAAPVGTFATR